MRGAMNTTLNPIVLVPARMASTRLPDQPLDDQALDAKVTGLFRWAGLSAAQSTRTLRACRALIRGAAVPALPRAAARD